MTKFEWNLQEMFANNQSFYDEINNVKQLLEDIKKYEEAELNSTLLLKLLDKKWEIKEISNNILIYGSLMYYKNVNDNECIEIRGIRIDKTARRVFVNDAEKIFTTKEFDLLTFLAQNPNHVFTKEELFQKIWGMESVGEVATVTVHIKKIREKIEMNTAKPQYIETIWGVGYRFKL